MMHERGIGRRRGFAIAALALALCVAAPELGAPAGAVAARGATRTELASRPAARSSLVARRSKKSRYQKKLARYLRAHPGLVARRLRSGKLKLRAGLIKKRPAQARAYLKAHPKKNKTGKKIKAGKKTKKKQKARRVVAAKKVKKKTTKKKRRTAAAIAAGAAAKKKKQAEKGHPLGLSGWAEILFLVMLPFLAVGLLLFITDRMRQPPAPPTPKRRRRTLVITPMRGNR